MSGEETKGPPFTFADRRGVVWDITLELGAARRIDSSDFGGLKPKEFAFLRLNEEGVRVMVFDTACIFAAIWAVVEPVAQEREIDVDQFGAAMDGPTIERAKAAWWGSLQHFFPELATSLSISIQAYKNGATRLNERVRTSGSQVQASIDKLVDQEVEAMLHKVERSVTRGEPSGVTRES